MYPGTQIGVGTYAGTQIGGANNVCMHEDAPQSQASGPDCPFESDFE